MNRRQRSTLDAIFGRPVPADLRWKDAASLINALGFELDERAGSRIAIVRDGRVNVIHKPHPQPEMKRYAVRDLRAILEAPGARPQKEKKGQK